MQRAVPGAHSPSFHLNDDDPETPTEQPATSTTPVLPRMSNTPVTLHDQHEARGLQAANAIAHRNRKETTDARQELTKNTKKKNPQFVDSEEEDDAVDQDDLFGSDGSFSDNDEASVAGARDGAESELADSASVMSGVSGA